MAATSIEVLKDNTKNIAKAVEALTRSSVYVGIPSTKTERKEGQPIGNAAIGYIQDKGSPENNIPARPWLAPGVRAVKDTLAGIFKKTGQNALSGDLSSVERGLEAAGMVAQVSVKKFITEGIPPPLKESTLAARRAAGRTGTTPLVDTAQMLNSVSYVVRKN